MCLCRSLGYYDEWFSGALLRLKSRISDAYLLLIKNRKDTQQLLFSIAVIINAIVNIFYYDITFLHLFIYILSEHDKMYAITASGRYAFQNVIACITYLIVANIICDFVGFLREMSF